MEMQSFKEMLGMGHVNDKAVIWAIGELAEKIANSPEFLVYVMARKITKKEDAMDLAYRTAISLFIDCRAKQAQA